MTVRLRVEGLGRLQQTLTVLPTEVGKVVDQAVVATAAAIQRGYVSRVQRGGRSGRVYEKYAPRRTHQASGPGEAPKTDTGQLANSAVVMHTPGTRSAQVVVTAPYAAALEFGSPGNNLAPRPALGPATKEEEPRYLARVQNAVAATLRARTGKGIKK